LKKIDGAANSLLGIINDILDYSKIQAGKLDIERISFQLEAVIDNLASVSSVMTQNKDIELLVERSNEVPVNLVGDPLRLNQILTNLLNNAIKFTEEGLIALRIDLAPGSEMSPQLVFTVEDTGIGMDEETVDHIFNPFEQADNSITRRFGGTGLGLSIVQQLISLMNGSLSVQSIKGEGTTFTVQLPFEKSEIEINYRAYESTSFEKLRVLVVDDSVEAVEVLEHILQGFGCHTALAYDAEHGIELVQQADKKNEPFDFVLMDWRLPSMDGLAASAEIKQHNQHPPVIIVETAYGQQLLRGERANTEHVDALLTKPIPPSSLFDTLIRFMDKTAVEATGVEVSDISMRLSGLHLLLVEDNVINQEVACKMLERAGASVLVANHGEEALSWMERSGARIDAILMDMQMPVMDGLQATQQIRERREWKLIPIIAMTANARKEDRQACLEAGMNDHVPKPIDPELLFSTITQWCGVPDSATLVEHAVHIEQQQESLQVIDLDLALARTSNDGLMLFRLLNTLSQQSHVMVKAAFDLYQQGHVKGAYAQLHNLKGSSGNLSVGEIHQLSSQILEKINAEERVDPTLFVALKEACERLQGQLPEIQKLLGVAVESSAAGQTKIVLNSEEDRVLYRDLVAALQAKDFEAEDLLEQFLDRQGEAARVALASVNEAIFGMQFDKALTELQQRVEP